VQKIIAEEAKGTEDFVRELAAKMDNELLEKMTSTSQMKPNEVDKDAFIAASGGIYEEFGKSVKNGAELIKEIRALAQ